MKKQFLGIVMHYFEQSQVGLFLLQNKEIWNSEACFK